MAEPLASPTNPPPVAPNPSTRAPDPPGARFLASDRIQYDWRDAVLVGNCCQRVKLIVPRTEVNGVLSSWAAEKPLSAQRAIPEHDNPETRRPARLCHSLVAPHTAVRMPFALALELDHPHPHSRSATRQPIPDKDVRQGAN